MTIKASGSLGMNEIAAEYSGTTPHSLSEYYTAPGLPASGAISFADFYGKSDLYTTSATTTYITYFNTSQLTSYITSYLTSYLTQRQTLDTAIEGYRWTYFYTSRTTSHVTSYTTTVQTSQSTSHVTDALTSWSAGNPT